MELHYFLTTNGSKGHYSFLDKNLANNHNTVFLAGYPRSVATTLIKECYTIAKQNRMCMHIVHNCLDASTEGIIFPDLQTAIINQPLYETRTDVASIFKNENIDLYHTHVKNAFDSFKKAKEIHDDWEQIYINVMNFDALDTFTESTINTLLQQQCADHTGSFCDRFFGSATINGSVDYINILSENTNRYFIKGRPGTGKSTFMKKLAQAAFDRGFHIERYHCSFDPNSLDMVVIRELSICLFDSTAPHEYFPSKETDKILDLYAAAVPIDTDVKFKGELASFAGRYKCKIDDAIHELNAANTALLRAEEECIKHINNNKLMDMRKEIIQRIFP